MYVFYTCHTPGEWMISTLFENERVEGGTFSITVFDPKSVSLSGPQNGVVGEAIVFKGKRILLSGLHPPPVSPYLRGEVVGAEPTYSHMNLTRYVLR